MALLAALLGSAVACKTAPEVATAKLDGGRLGTLTVYGGSEAKRGVVFLFSDASGWDADCDRAVGELALKKYLAVAVDLPTYLKGLAASDDGCHYLVSELEALSKQLQRERGFPSYVTPALAGFGEGGTLAYATLAQSPAATIAGAAAIDPTTSLETPKPLCEGAKVTDRGDGSFSYDGHAKLPGWFRSDAVADDRRVEHLVALVLGPQMKAKVQPSTEISKDLPLVEYPVEGLPQVLAVIYSGDGGWRDIDKQIGEALQARGIPVVGLDSMRSFWNEKSPDDVGRELTQIIDQYGDAWHTDEVLLVGYSFGASMMPFAFNRLPDDVRATVKQMSLLGLGSMASFKFTVGEWLGAESRDRRPVLPELVQMDPSLVQCFYGEGEEDTLCKDDAASLFEVIGMSGGHHFGGDYATIVDRIVAGLAKRGAHVE